MVCQYYVIYLPDVWEGVHGAPRAHDTSPLWARMPRLHVDSLGLGLRSG